MKKKSINIGDLIVADANILNDLQFNRTVILLTKYNSNGCLGFILNRKLNIKLKEIIPDTDSNIKIYYGGPVEPENLYFIHNVPSLIPNSIEISDGLYWAGEFSNIIELINQKKINQNNIRFFLGYTGWDQEQLICEIDEKTWLIKENIYKNNLLKKVPSNLWKELMMTFGNNEIIWCNAPEDPVLN